MVQEKVKESPLAMHLSTLEAKVNVKLHQMKEVTWRSMILISTNKSNYSKILSLLLNMSSRPSIDSPKA